MGSISKLPSCQPSSAAGYYVIAYLPKEKVPHELILMALLLADVSSTMTIRVSAKFEPSHEPRARLAISLLSFVYSSLGTGAQSKELCASAGPT